MNGLPPDNGARQDDQIPDVSGGTTASMRDVNLGPRSAQELDFSSSEQEKTVISRRPISPPAEYLHSIPLVELARWLEGKSLDHFHVEQMIGGGGMGAVFRGTDMRLGRTVAIKVVPTATRDPDSFRRFRMEAQSAARLDHPNIARVYYIGESDKWNYIVFEYIEGINLRDLVEMEGPLSIDDAVFYTRQVAEALQHAHQRDVVHRDIKPSNVLITPTGIVKLVDMGLARSTAMERSSADMTASGVTLGTFDYISPEQARNPRDADVRSDLYSLGCTLFYMLSGRPPFPEGTALQKLLNHGSQPPPDLRHYRDDLSDQLYAVLMKLMSKRPIDRYQKPNDLINDLLLVAEAEDLIRSQTPGTFLLAASPAERSLIEANAPWLVAVVLLLGISLWQNVEINGAFFELPQPEFHGLAVSPQSKAVSSQIKQQEIALPDSPVPATLSGMPTPLGELRSSVPAVIDHNPHARNLLEPTNNGLEASAQPAELMPQETTAAGAVIGNVSEVDPTKSVDTGSAPADSWLHRLAEDTLVVTTEFPSDANDQWCKTLVDAMSKAEVNPSIRIIELRSNFLVRERITITRSGLTLRAPVDKKIELVFTPSSFFVSDSIECMVDVGAHDLRLENLVVICSNPMDTITRRSAIFSVEPAGQLELVNCNLTFADSTGMGENRAISIERPGPSADEFDFSDFATESTVASSDSRFNDPASIKIRNCWIRGEMDLVGMDAGYRVELAAQQLWLAISEQMFDARTDDSGRSPYLRVSLRESTLACAEGFCRIRMGAVAEPTECLNRTAQSCVFWSQSTNSHIILEQVPSAEAAGSYVVLKGEDNAYDRLEDQLIEVRTVLNQPGHMSVTDGLNTWFRERGNDYSVRWQNPIPLSKPFHQQVPTDYQLKDSMFMPGFITGQ